MVDAEHRVETLFFLGGVTYIVIPALPDGVLHLSTSSPSPEVAAGYFARFSDDGEDIIKVAVTSLGGRTGRKEEAVARITELLQYDRTLAELFFLSLSAGVQHLVGFVDVGFGGVAGSAYIVNNGVWSIGCDGLVGIIVLVEFAYPSPVVGPDMDAGIVDAGQGVDGAEEFNILLTSVFSLRAVEKRCTYSSDLPTFDSPWFQRNPLMV